MSDYVDVISMNMNDPNLKPNDGGFQSCDPGTYDFEIEKQSTAQSGAGNNTLRITGKVIGPAGSAMIGRTVMAFYVIAESDFARGRMKSIVDATGIPVNADGSFAREAFVGLQFTADVESRPGKKIDKNGNETETNFTSWVRERPLGTEVGSGAVAAAPTPAKPTAPAATGNAARRPAPPNGNGQARRQ